MFHRAMFPFIFLRWQIYSMTCSVYCRFCFVLFFSPEVCFSSQLSGYFSPFLLLWNDFVCFRFAIFLCFLICQWGQISRARVCLFERSIDFFFFFLHFLCTWMLIDPRIALSPIFELMCKAPSQILVSDHYSFSAFLIDCLHGLIFLLWKIMFISRGQAVQMWLLTLESFEKF